MQNSKEIIKRDKSRAYLPLISSRGSVTIPAFNRSRCACDGGPEAGMLIVPFWFMILHFRLDRSKTLASVSREKRATKAA